MKRTLIRLGLTALISSALFGCGGGSDGVPGGPANVNVTINPPTTGTTFGANSTTPSPSSLKAWQVVEPKVTVLSVSVNSPPVVKFAVTDASGNAIIGLDSYSKSSTATVKALANFGFTLAKLVPATATENSKWVSYLVVRPPSVAQYGGTGADICDAATKATWCGSVPTTDTEGTLVDNKDGTYQYTFARDITKMSTIVASLGDSATKKKADLGSLAYEPSLTHRLGIQLYGAAPGTGRNRPDGVEVQTAVNMDMPTNIYYDFRPDGGAVSSTRSIVDVASCGSCHMGKGLAHGAFGRKDPNYCVTCHTDQLKYGSNVDATTTPAMTVSSGVTTFAATSTTVVDGRAVGNFPNLIHKAHMGSELTLKNYNFANVKFNETEWIQDPRDCTKCHNGDTAVTNMAVKTDDGNNWKNKPNRLACGACHDSISFAASVPTGMTAHTGGVATDGDASCASCHASAGPAGGIDVAHRTEAATTNNPIPIAGISDFDYVIKSVAVNATTGATTFKFVINQDGAPVTTLATGAQAIPGFNSGPSLYVAFAVPQDGIAAPADFNTYVNVSLASLLVANNTSGTLAVDVASGIWTATLTGTSLKIPATAKMVTGAIIGNFTQVDFNATKSASLDTTTALGKKWNVKPTGSTNFLNGTTNPGLFAKTPLQKMVATGYTARRVIVENAKCQSCHEQLGTAVEFHSGARNDATACAICHNPNRTSSAWSANASTFIHGIHAGTSPTTVAAITTNGANGTRSTAEVGVPGSGKGGAGAGFNSGKRTIPFSWHRAGTATVPTWNAASVVYPGILKRCESCHVPNAVNFGANAATLLPNLLWSTSVASASATAPTGTSISSCTPMSTDPTPVALANPNLAFNLDVCRVYPRDPVTGLPPHANLLVGGNAYGDAFKFTASTGVSIPAAATTLVESPISAACFACHDSSTARTHIAQNGGTIYGTRTAAYSSDTATTYGGRALENKESCLTCHGLGRDYDAAVVHSK